MFSTSKIERSFFAPIFDDEEITRRASILNSTIVISLLVTLLFFISAVIGKQGSASARAFGVILFFSLLLCKLLLNTGKIGFFSFFFPIVLFVCLTAVNISLGTIRTPMAAVYALLVILTGMLFQLPGIVIATSVSSLTVLALMVAENADLLPKPDYSVGITQWMNLTTLFSVSAGVLHYTNNLLNKALLSAKVEIAQHQELEIQLRKLACVVRQMPSCIVITDLAGTIEYVNPRFCEVTGYSFDEVVGQNPRIIKSEKTASSTHKQLWDALTAGKDWQGELVNRKKDGALYIEWAVMSPIEDEGGRVTHYMAVLEDITIRKQGEEALRISEQRQRLIAENIRDVIWTMAPSGKITFVTPTVMALRGFTADETMNQPMSEIVSANSQALVSEYFKQLNADLETGSPPMNFRDELECLCRDGTTIWTEVIAFPLVNENGVLEILGMARDISEQKIRQIELEKQGRRLEDQIIQLDRQRTLGQMSAALGHELNQPLTAILTNAQIMQRGIRTGRLESTQVEEFLERIIYNTRRTSDIIERIRTYIRPNDVNLISLDLMQVLHDTLALVREDSDRHKVLIKFVRTQHPFNVKGDAIQLSQVLLNVLRNAVEALQHVERREIEIQISTTKDQVTLTITDTGPGLTPRDLEQVGNPFFSTKKNGLGLGLSISRNIIDKFQGTLTIANAEPIGVCVTITLPRIQSPP